MRMTFQPMDDTFLPDSLDTRGFNWIQERPFNR
jgi:hypothetical protein